MSLIQVNNLTFYYDGSYDSIFEDVSFQIDTDWKLALVGRNGRGKTTLLNLLLGKYEYKGSISSAVLFDYFPFSVCDKKRQTLDVIETVCPEYEFWKLCRELSLMEADCNILYRSFSSLSNGEQTKVLLALLFSKENHFLLIDEPTNHLDAESRRVLSQYLNRKTGYILVSHDQNFLDRCTDHVLAINQQDITVTKGNFSTWWKNKQNQDEHEIAQNIQLKKDIRRLNTAFDRTKSWSDQIEKSKIGNHLSDRGFVGHKSAKMMKRAKSIETRAKEAIDEKSGLLKNIESSEHLNLIPLTHHKNVLVHIEELSICYHIHPILNHFNLDIRTGDRIVLSGRNGCGKSSILKTVLGELKPSHGIVQTASGLIISYVSQDTSTLNGSLTEYCASYKLEETLFKAFLYKLDFSRTQFDKPMEHFSGGQKKKVLLARSLCQQAHLYVWDEPLNFIDIFSRMQIEALILEFCPTMLLVEHDISFAQATATKIITL